MIRRTWAPAVLLLLVIIGSTVLVGCNLKQGNGAAAESVEVQVAKPVEQKFEDYEVFTGRTEATLYTTIRARVSGYLEAANFVEGRDVKKDDVLFEVDPAPYKAAYDQTDAAWKQAEAHRARLELDHNRAVDLYAKRAMSKSDYDLAVGDYTEAVAAVGSAAANRQSDRFRSDRHSVNQASLLELGLAMALSSVARRGFNPLTQLSIRIGVSIHRGVHQL